MSVQEEIQIMLPKQISPFGEREITFSINNMKCEHLAVVYFKLHCYDLEDNEILINDDAYYVSKRWGVDNDWSTYYETFTIDENIFQRLKSIQLELRFVLVDSDNPIYFTQLMLQDTLYVEGDYHAPSEAQETSIVGFNKNTYVNLYKVDEEDYLQVIRTSTNPFEIHSLSKNDETVLVPHIMGECEWDKPENIFVEYITQTEQFTTIKPI